MVDGNFQPWWVLAAAGVVLLLAGGTLIVDAGRRRQHRRLVREAVTAMCVAQRSAPPLLRRLHRELARILVQQDDNADYLERVARPLVPAVGTAPADETPRRGLAEAIATARSQVPENDPTALVTIALGPPKRNWSELDPGEHADDLARPIRVVPRLADVEGSAELYGEMRSTVRALIHRTHVLLSEAARIGEPSDACRAELTRALRHAVEVEDDSGQLAAAGQPLAALRALTSVNLPLAEKGIPGEGARRDLRRQAYALADLALLHRDALALWSRDALARCGPVSILPGEVIA